MNIAQLMEMHLPMKLGPTERVDLASITKHPGMTVLVDKILRGHALQQREMIHEVALDDADRITKLSAICAVADAMKLTLELVRRELDYNWRMLQEEEERRAKEAAAENETERTQ